MPFDAETFDYTTVDPLALTEPRQRLEYLRDFLRKLEPSRFGMQKWACRPKASGNDWYLRNTNELIHDCGTAACIGGWAVALFAPQSSGVGNHGDAGEVLGLSRDDSFELFYPNLDWTAVTKFQAANVIDHLLKTGEVDWGVADCGA